MVALSDGDAVVIESLRHEFETMDDFSPEGPNSSVTVDPAAVLGQSVDGDHRASIFYSPMQGEFMDWGFRLSCKLRKRDAFPQAADHVVTEFTPYAKLVVEQVVQTWAEVDIEDYHPPDDGWISGIIMDAEYAKHARETYAKVHDEQPPENYFSSILEADEELIRMDMETVPDVFDSADDFRQRCSDRREALYHIDYTGSELTQLY